MASGLVADRPVRAVIFDLDGVLIDSESVALGVARELLAEAGVTRTLGDLRHLCGQRGGALRAYLQDALGDDERGATMAARAGEAVQARVDAGEMRPFQGAAAAVRALRGAGLRLAIASSSGRRRVERELAGSGIAEHVDLVVTGEDVTHGKPHPEIFLTAAAGLGVAPEECVVVEDSLAGVSAGRRAGMRVVAVAQTFPRDALRDADLVLDVVGEVPGTLLAGTAGAGAQPGGPSETP